ncbi:MAG TPA: bifunctional 5,10-methylenetetrahydrofolate dehydrogenase/5,10-methenyltetrahydrofolate cyclohydrolase [Terriglobales bacterium]|nr:bifunctional 5,10-methylenetetrahydrofolate dehydrogenase/5,10-methenyltetrahydrofolate cyclohydrolase [Terriglobales bacterium]
MPAILLDGTRIGSEIKAEVAAEAKGLFEAGIRPGLAAVLVGNDPASEVYVRSKVRACEALGFFSEQIARPANSTTVDIVALVRDLNERDEVDGILVQLPLPRGIDSRKVLLEIDPAKDVDGLHPFNVGNLAANHPTLVACTPAGVMEILRRSDIPVEGREAVVVGRSDIVGKPIAMLLTNANATVTVCHSKTQNLPAVCRRADILVAAIGRAAMITEEFVKPGATVIDVGINRVSDAALAKSIIGGDPEKLASFEKRGYILAGDVLPAVAGVAGALTPVPGGVGPLTIAMLMSNTLKAAKLRRGSQVAIGKN